MLWSIISILIFIILILICSNTIAKHSDEKMKEIMKNNKENKEKIK